MFPIRRVLLLFVPVAALIVGAGWFFARAEIAAAWQTTSDVDARNLARGAAVLALSVDAPTRDVRYLAGSASLAAALDDPAPAKLARVAADFSAFSDSHEVYDQIRWLDERGRELVRVDRVNGRAVVVPAGELQDKSRRYFFSDTQALPPGEVFVSPLDLNVDHDQIAIPYKPTLRAGTPVHDRAGRARGVVMVNTLGKHLLDAFDLAMAGSPGEAMLVNRDGYWLRSPRADDEWGFMFNRPATFATRHPAAWVRMAGAERGHFEDAEGLWTFDTVRPLRPGGRTSTGTGEIAAPSVGQLSERDYFWKAIAHVSPAALAAMRERVWQRVLPPLAVALAFMLFVCTRHAAAWQGLERAEGKLRAVNAELESKVAERTREIEAREQEHLQLLEDLPDAAAVARVTDGELLYGNPAFLKLLAIDAAASGPVSTLGHYADPQQRDRIVARLRESGGIVNSDVRARAADGREIEGVLAARIGRFRGEEALVTVFTDLTERKEIETALQRVNAQLSDRLSQIALLQATLQEQAIRDGLTGLYNRRFVEEACTRELARAEREGSPVSLVMFDLDHFKRINDTFGHAAGDEVIIAVGRLLQKHARSSDTACRFGGEEFVLLLPGMDLPDARVRVDGMRAAFAAERIEFGTAQLSATISAGIATFPVHARTTRRLIACADEALYAAKGGGRNRVEVFQPGDAAV
jgi:diguanylate cyclase (GGDEF)-like protein/PAS domain S-box-containing protein